MGTIQCEVTPLTDEDLFVLLNNPKAKFDYPIHFHSDYELNLVMNTSGKTFERVKERLLNLSNARGFNTALEFYSILYDLSIADEQRLLTSASYDSSLLVRESRSRRIEKICQYIEVNFKKDITLKEIAELVNMSESAISHFFKKRTNRSFITYLTDVRIGYASRLLAETTQSVADIAFECGFSNLSNFNRIFKKYKNQTPTDYRIGVHKTITKF